MKIGRASGAINSPQVFAAGLAATVLLISFQWFGLWDYDLRVPLSYSEGDTVIMLMYIKGLVQDGWPTTITHLSAPFVYPGAAFPQLTSTDWAIIKVLSIFTSEPGTLLNMFWLLTLVFSAWTAAYAAYQLRLSKTLAFASGVLYAFLPFALMRSVHHLNLVYYLVPLHCLLAVVIAGGGDGARNSRNAIIAGLAACVLQGFDYVYYSFFAALLFGMAALVSCKRGELRALRLPALAIVLVSASTAINLTPAFLAWEKHGLPPEMGYKSIAESEIYGAKLRLMLSPHAANPIEPFGRIARTAAQANFPNENENTTARLGLYGALGLLIMILSLLRLGAGTPLQQPMGSISSLGLATLLVITVGGFGAVINVLSVPDIRAYNRFSVYLSFFSMTAAGLWLQEKIRNANMGWRSVGVVLLGCFIAFSLYDQLLDGVNLRVHLTEETLRVRDERAAVARLERAFPAGASVLELPFTGYPPISHFQEMMSYDHGRPYLWSRHVKWSWPSFTRQHRTWQNKLNALYGSDLVRAAALSGFDAIWLDRAAYKDQGREMLASLASGNAQHVDIDSTRYAVLDIRRVATGLRAQLGENEFRRQSSSLLGGGLLLEWNNGFYDEERDPEGRRFRWAKNAAELDLRNPGDRDLEVCATFDIASPNDGIVQIEGSKQTVKVQTSGTRQPVRLALHVAAGKKSTLRFLTSLPRLDVPGDPRNLHFYIMELDLSPKPKSGDCTIF
ncbi:hypothetical protein [Noviherbaspirillum sp.]|jgi:phosphoglycerol transferase|uniref:hypothetical protein n=1 Tax=Noviherbaspirillum sp. TaxID=1926288 RepID=UPI0025DA47AA|nr:hypothetical protein [Noviherbaspirillum sp.]